MSEPSKDTGRSTDTVIRERTEDGYRIRLDVSRQVLRLSSPSPLLDAMMWDQVEEPLSPTPASAWAASSSLFPARLLPAGLLVQKAKQFDDGLYATVELAAQRGNGRFPGKATLLPGLARALASHATGLEACRLMLAACRLGGLRVKEGPALGKDGEAAIAAFLEDEGDSKPLGFYTWSPALEGIFRQDRLLQRRLSEPITRALVAALRADAALREAYRGHLALTERLTNPYAERDLRGLLEASGTAPLEATRFFPPAVSHEIELAKRLFGDRGAPFGYGFMDGLIDAIRARAIDVEPRPESGWYDFQTWAHAAFLVPDRMPEASRLILDDGYRKTLEELFRGAQALARETHLKSLEVYGLGANLPEMPPRPVLMIEPGLTVEPLVTFFERRAAGYAFVRTVLEEAFGAAALAGMHRLTPEGPVEQGLGAELSDMIALFRGARATAATEIGLTSARGSATDAQRFTAWRAGLTTDVDLERDARMMLPVAQLQAVGPYKVWMFLGWVARTLDVEFEEAPTAEVFDAAGRRLAPGKDFELSYVSERHELLAPVMVERLVPRLLDRKEFRAHCDRYRTQSAILEALR